MDVTKLHKPNVADSTAKELILRLYGLEVTAIRKMKSFNDQNYHIKVSPQHHNPFLSSVCEDGYTIKIINTMKSSLKNHFESMHSAMRHLDQKGIRVPLPVLNLQGRTWAMVEVPLMNEDEVSPDCGNCGIHLLTYLSGESLSNGPYTSDNLYQWGVLTAKFNEALKDFENPALREKKIFSSLEFLPMISDFVHDEHKKLLVSELLKRVSNELEKQVNDLPKGFIHGDVNGYNFLMKAQGIDNIVDGTLDFEDMHYGVYIWDIGFLLTHAIIGLGSNLEAVEKAGHALAGYQTVRALNDLELSLLKICIECRLGQSAVLCEYDSKRYPNNSYVLQLASDQKKWDILEQLKRMGSKDLLKLWNGIQKQYKCAENLK